MFSMFKKSSDPYEEMLNGLKRRILNGETISMMDFLYVLDDLADEPDEIPTDAEIREAADAREWFLSELRRFGLPLETRHTLCRTLYEKANAEPSQALLRLLCYILCDDGNSIRRNRTRYAGGASVGRRRRFTRNSPCGNKCPSGSGNCWKS